MRDEKINFAAVMKRIAICLSIVLLAASCGVTKKVSSSDTVKIPTQAEADSIMNLSNAAVFVVEKASGPVIYGFTADTDSAKVNVYSKVPVKKVWTDAPTVTYPCASEYDLPLVSGPDSACVREIAGKRYLSFTTERMKGSTVQKTLTLYQADLDNICHVSFDGSIRRDGKIYGRSDIAFQENNSSPQMQWADSVILSDSRFVALSDEQLMSDQAIDWWLEKNPSAQTRATKVNFGSLPAECTLVQQFASAKKESNKSYRVALFDTVEYTVIVSQNRSTGAYSLVWVEPRCRNKKTDQLLNSIYFSNGNYLALFYYKGNRTFKYNLSVASGQLQR